MKCMSLTCPYEAREKKTLTSLPSLAHSFSLIPDLLFDCSGVLEYAKIQTVLQSKVHRDFWNVLKK